MADCFLYCYINDCDENNNEVFYHTNIQLPLIYFKNLLKESFQKIYF